MEQPIRIVMADDHPIVRQGLRADDRGRSEVEGRGRGR